LENPDVNWDGTDGNLMEFINCASGEIGINWKTTVCPGASPYGMLNALYQAPDGSPDPYQTAAPCTNVLYAANPGLAGWCYMPNNAAGCDYTVGPGNFEALVQTDLIGGSCAPGTLAWTITNP
jgi:hypothetical protein